MAPDAAARIPDDRTLLSATPILEAEDLCFAARGQLLVDRVNLRIAAGRRTAVMGANGTGKSTLLRLLHGLIKPASGRILWRGRPLDAESRRSQAMVFQRPVMLRRSVVANLRFALGARGISRPECAKREAMAMESAQLEGMANRPARVLSAGEQQRLAVARALACLPEILFLDEPTANLDPASTHAIERLILDASRNGVTIVVITHDVGQARRLGQDAVFMHAGRIVETGSIEGLLGSPESEAARHWLAGRLFLDAPETAQDSSRNGSPRP